MPHPGLFHILKRSGVGYFISCGERGDEGVRETGRGRRRAKKHQLLVGLREYNAFILVEFTMIARLYWLTLIVFIVAILKINY